MEKQWLTLLKDKFDQSQLLPTDFSTDNTYDDIDPTEQVPDLPHLPDMSTDDDAQQSSPRRLRSGRTYYVTTTPVYPFL